MKKQISLLLMLVVVLSVANVLATEQEWQGNIVNIEVNPLDFGFIWGSTSDAKPTILTVTPQGAAPPETSLYVVKDDGTGSFGDPSTQFLSLDLDLTLDELFAGDGFSYTYTVLEGGIYNGAAPIVAVFELEDGSHIVLFPGWGSRTGEHTLIFSDDVAEDTGGNNVVDFVVYNDLYGDTSNRWSNGGSYPAWTNTKALSGCPVDGTEKVVRTFFMHQGANTGQEDRLESILLNQEEIFLGGGLGLQVSAIDVNVAEGSADVMFSLEEDGTFEDKNSISLPIPLNPLNQETLWVQLQNVGLEDVSGTITYTINTEFQE